MVERNSAAFEKLTPREREILRLIAAHLQSKEIARTLGLSPKTVEMHVLSARRRLSGMSRRDAALAFVAWEAGDPGNDYRKRPDGMAALVAALPAGGEVGNGHDRASSTTFGGAPSGDGRLDHGSRAPPPVRRDWRRELSNLQWFGFVLALTTLTAVCLAIIAVSLHHLMMALQGIHPY